MRVQKGCSQKRPGLSLTRIYLRPKLKAWGFDKLIHDKKWKLLTVVVFRGVEAEDLERDYSFTFFNHY